MRGGPVRRTNTGRLIRTRSITAIDKSVRINSGVWDLATFGERFAALAATDHLLFGSEEALDDLRQHRLDGERVVGGVRHDCELVCGPQ